MTYYLASGDDLPKGIVGLVIFAIWVISAIAGGIKKKNQMRPQGSSMPQPSALEAFQREIAQRMQEAQRQMQSPLPPFPSAGGQPLSNRQRVLGQQQRAANVREAKRIKQAQQQLQRKRKSVPPPIPAPSPARAIVEEVPPIEAVKPPSLRPQAPSVNASVIAKWMKPTTLRQQFIITEIFQPPLSMRE